MWSEFHLYTKSRLRTSQQGVADLQLLHKDLLKARSHKEPPPRAVSSSYPRGQLQMGTLSLRSYHGFWLKETQS